MGPILVDKNSELGRTVDLNMDSSVLEYLLEESVEMLIEKSSEDLVQGLTGELVEKWVEESADKQLVEADMG